jgi:glycosyltransferase involved in cell wall biosynthesis
MRPMQSVPLISVVVRSMDRDSLARPLRSLAAQDHAAAEILVVNATGRPHRILPERCGAYPLRVVGGERKLPRAEAANLGLESAAGDLIYFLDDDDEALPGALKALAGALERNPASALVHGVSIVVDAQGRQIQRLGSPYRKEMRLDCGFLTPGDFLMRRSLVERGARFDPALEILEDMEFFIQCSELTDLVFVDVPVHRYWSAAGDSGAGGTGNTDPARLRRALGYIAAKWGARRTG